jgi:hypothetical protein
MVPLMFGLIFLLVAIIYSIYTLKKEYFIDAPPGIDLLQMIPRSVFRIIYVIRDIPNAQPRATAIINQVASNSLSIDAALDQFYAIFMEGEAKYKSDAAKPYSSIFTDALDDAMREAMKDPNINPLERAAVEQAVQKFKTKIAAQTALTAGAPASTTSPSVLAAALATPRGVADVTGVGAAAAAPGSAAAAVPAAASAPKDIYSQMRPSLLSDVRSAVKSELAASGIRQNADTLRVSTSGTANLDTVGTNQGVDYDNISTKGPFCQGDAEASCPPEHNGCENGDMNDSCPAPIDMNKYIRKDSIPCWGCTLPTDY